MILPLASPAELREELAEIARDRHPRGRVIDQARFLERQADLDRWKDALLVRLAEATA